MDRIKKGDVKSIAEGLKLLRLNKKEEKNLSVCVVWVVYRVAATVDS